MEGEVKAKGDSVLCPVPNCTVLLSRRDYLRRHLARVHFLNPDKYLPPAPKRQKVKEGEGGFPCTVGGCDAILSKRVHLYRHLRQVHKMEPLQNKGAIKSNVESAAEEIEVEPELPPREVKMEGGVPCVLCCALLPPPSSDDAGGFQLSNFAGEVLQEYLSSENMRQTLQSLSVCDKCLRRVDKVLRERRELKEAEVKVRELQRQLLLEMRGMYEKVKDFWREMRGLGDVVEGSGDQYVELYVQNPESDVVLDLRNAISSVVKDLEKFRDAMASKVAVTSKPMKRVKSAAVKRREVKREVVTESPPPVAVPPEEAARENVIKTELLSDAEQEEDHDCDLSLPSPTSPLPPGEDASADHEPPNDEDEDSDWHQSSGDEGGSREESVSGDESELEAGPEGEKGSPLPKAPSKRKLKLHKAKDSVAKRKRDKDLSPTDLDTTSWSAFKLKLYSHVMRSLQKREKALQNPPDDGIPDPRLHYCLEYHRESDTFSVGGITVIPHDTTESIECSACHHMATFSPTTKYPVTSLIQSHVQSKHLSIYTCAECGSVLGSWHRYRKHVASHQGRFLCTDCGKSLSSEETLRAHRWSKHFTPEQIAAALAAGEKDTRRALPVKGHFACDFCGKVFTQSSSLYTHQRTTHEGDRNRRICAQCGQSFASKQSLEYHQQYSCVPPGEKPPPQVPCEVKGCEKTFKNQQLMRRHFLTVHTENAILKPFRCEVCGAGFPAKNQLTRHRQIHTNERPFACGRDCGSTFKMKKHLSRHEKGCSGKMNAPRGPRTSVIIK